MNHSGKEIEKQKLDDSTPSENKHANGNIFRNDRILEKENSEVLNQWRIPSIINKKGTEACIAKSIINSDNDTIEHELQEIKSAHTFTSKNDVNSNKVEQEVNLQIFLGIN